MVDRSRFEKNDVAPVGSVATRAVVSSLPPEPSASPSVARVEALPDVSSAPTSRPVAPSTPRATWAKAVELGRYDDIVREATSLGIDNVTKTASLDDLVALSEAARYSGHGDVANQALGAVRSRFPESAPAHTATFLLGRMAEESGASARAVSLYDEYLASGGAFSGGSARPQDDGP